MVLRQSILTLLVEYYRDPSWVQCCFCYNYINDINYTLNLCKTKLYADDTVVYASHQNEDVCHDWLCINLLSLLEWFNMNKLTINLDKTRLMLYGEKNMQKKAKYLDVERTGTKLQYVRQFNYLGVKLDNRLTFETRANECIRLVSHKLFLLTKNKEIYRQETGTHYL